jgi:hypothetical protein
MRDGLAREFPDAGRASAWAHDRFAGGPALWREPVVWATISGIGAGFLVGAVAQAVVSLANEALQALRSPQPFTLVPLVTIPGTAAAAAVALSVGGTLALALYFAYLLLGVALRIPGLMFACERSGGVLPFPGPDQCTAVGFLASLWPQLIGLGLGILVARTFTARGDGINSSLRVAGSLALAVFVVSQAWAANIAQGGYAVPNDALASGLTVAAAMIAAAVAAGVIAAHVPSGIRSASFVALFWLLPWLAGQLPYALRTLPGPIAAENVAPIALGIAIQPLAAAFLVLSAIVTSRARFIPRDTA